MGHNYFRRRAFLTRTPTRDSFGLGVSTSKWQPCSDLQRSQQESSIRFAVQDQSGVDLIESTAIHTRPDSVLRKTGTGSSYRNQDSGEVPRAP